MKKSLLLAIAMIVAAFGAANAEIRVNVTSVEQPANDTLLFALPVDTAHHQEIWTTYVHPESGQDFRPIKYQPEYLVTANDFTCGDTERGTATLPKNAKVIGLALEGYLQACEDKENACYQVVTAWCRNIPVEQTILDYLDLFDGYSTHEPEGELCTDTTNYHGLQFNNPGVICKIDTLSTKENRCDVVKIPFGRPDAPRMPFWYMGENIYLTLWLINRYNPVVDGGTHIEYHYMAYDEAEVEYASLMRSGNLCFNSITQHLVNWVPGWENSDGLMYELPKHRLPAFRTPYYTNDATITCHGYETLFEVRDPDGNVLVPDETGVDENGHDYSKFNCLDHTMEYRIYTVIGGEHYRGSFTFEDIYKDVEVILDNRTAVEEIDANKTVANVAYYNLAGQQSAQPVDGVNIVVTTYTDGSTSTAKVIK